jgi:hypothetical protein
MVSQTMKGKILMISLLGIFLTSSLALADTLVSSGNFYNMNIPLNESGNTFWDNPSLDGPDENVGYLLSLPAGAQDQSQVPSLQFLATYDRKSGTYNAVNDVYFSGTGQNQVVSLMYTLAASAPRNTLYAYNVADPTQRIMIVNGALQSGAGSISVSIPYAQWGLMVTGPGGTFYSQSKPASVPDSNDATSNFAFFQDANNPLNFIVGIETLPDGIYQEGLGDYNDMVIEIDTAPSSAAPVPPTLILLATGLLGLSCMGLSRRRRQNSKPSRS